MLIFTVARTAMQMTSTDANARFPKLRSINLTYRESRCDVKNKYLFYFILQILNKTCSVGKVTEKCRSRRQLRFSGERFQDYSTGTVRAPHCPSPSCCFYGHEVGSGLSILRYISSNDIVVQCSFCRHYTRFDL